MKFDERIASDLPISENNALVASCQMILPTIFTRRQIE